MRVREHQMAKYPCSLGSPLFGLLDLEQVGIPVHEPHELRHRPDGVEESRLLCSWRHQGHHGSDPPGFGSLIERLEADLPLAPPCSDGGRRSCELYVQELIHHADAEVLAAWHELPSRPPAGPFVFVFGDILGGWTRWRFRVWQYNRSAER